MLFMVIERFKEGALQAAGERFQRSGRMLPEGVAYVNSWMDASGARCFQLIEAPNRESLDPWISRWDDFVDFEIFPVLSSSEFWQNLNSGLASEC